MTRTVWLLIFSYALNGCGTESEDTSFTDQSDSDDQEWLEATDDVVETGSLSTNLPGEHGSGEAMCSINITRVVNKRLASINLTLDVVGEGCDAMGNCDNPNMRSGQLIYNGGIDGDQPFATMILNYEPPDDSEEELLWMYDVIYNTAPTSSFDMRVDGETFNVLTSDTRGAEDLSIGPHLWNTKIDIEADMLRSTDADNQSPPGLQTRGKFSYEGNCEIYAKVMEF